MDSFEIDKKKLTEEQKKFFLDNCRFFDDGLLRVIYCTDKLCICNMSNQTYAAFCYADSKDGQIGILGNVDAMRGLIENPLLTPIIMKKCLLNNNSVFTLNDSSYNVMKKFKLINDAKGHPTDSIDFDFEAEMMELSKSKQGMSR